MHAHMCSWHGMSRAKIYSVHTPQKAMTASNVAMVVAPNRFALSAEWLPKAFLWYVVAHLMSLHEIELSILHT